MVINSGVYVIKNILNNRVYIGSTKNFDNRWRDHRALLKSNRHQSPELQRDWNEYGEHAFLFIRLLEIEDKNKYWLAEIHCIRASLSYNIYNKDKRDNWGSYGKHKEIIRAMKKVNLNTHFPSRSVSDKLINGLNITHVELFSTQEG